jgi:hypothetical protein
MNTSLRNRTLLATALGALLASGFGASAAPPQAPDWHEHARPDQAVQPQKKKHEADAAAPRQARPQPQARRQPIERQSVQRRAPEQRAAGQRAVEQRAVEQRAVEQRSFAQRQAEVRDRVERDSRQVDQQRQRNDDSRRYADSRARTERERAQRLQQQRRTAQYRYQQEYYRRVNVQQARLAALRYDYNSNPYIRLPASYRYNYGGNWHATNRYGADMLRQAVNHGYQEGLRAGRADRDDRWGGDYRDSFAWTDGSYGYDNYYVSRSDYQYYFRQGFQRGYEDGYSRRSRYGRYDDRNDTAIILGTVLAAILNLQPIG